MLNVSVSLDLPLASPAVLPPSVLADDDSGMTFAVCAYSSDGSAPTIAILSRGQLLATVQSLPDAALTAADIRTVDPRLNRLEPARIVTRSDATLVSLGGACVGALILQGQFYIIGFSADNPVLKTAKAAFARLRAPAYRHSGDLGAVPDRQQSALRFRLAALEAILMGAVSEVHARTADLVHREQEELGRRATNSLFLIVREMATRVDLLARQASDLDAALCAALDSLSDSDAERRPERLLEGYLDHVRASRTVLASMKLRIDDDAACANLLLDRTRNRLIKFDVVASTVAAVAGIGSVAAGIFGMNLPAVVLANEQGPGSRSAPFDNWLFTTIALSITGLIGVVVIIVLAIVLCGRHLTCSWCAPSSRTVLAGGSRRGVAAVRAQQETRAERWRERFRQIKSVKWSNMPSPVASVRLDDDHGGGHCELQMQSTTPSLRQPSAKAGM